MVHRGHWHARRRRRLVVVLLLWVSPLACFIAGCGAQTGGERQASASVSDRVTSGPLTSAASSSRAASSSPSGGGGGSDSVSPILTAILGFVGGSAIAAVVTKTVDVRLARNARENALEDLRASLRREEVAVAQQATHDVRTTAAGLFKARLEGGPGEGQAVADGTEKLLAAIPKLRGATINAAMALGTAGRLAPLMEQITRSATTFVTSIGPAGDASSIEQAFSALSADLGGLERELVAGVEQRKGQE